MARTDDRGKLDLGRAWNQATAMLAANRDVVLIVAGVFVFLPNLVVSILMPQADAMTELEARGPDLAPEEMMNLLGAFYASYWWAFILLGLIQAVGLLGLLALLTDRSRPTVGQALVFGVKALLPYFVAQLLVSLIVLAVAVLLVALGAIINPALAVLLGLVALIVAVWLWIKFSLVSPVIAIEKVMNPLRALQRSWHLTRGNSLHLLAFFFLLVVAMVVVSIVVSLVLSLFALAGDDVGTLASAIGGALVTMVFVAVFMAVLAALHRQLAGPGDEATAETFD
ncbi:glycerophosphoryl diester phosphodiesterase membrane domain-containing protein [Aurantiacibacter spongiae]|nr:glycerophosphoryl diester phosphodiesterase membrane domain-containing protein [Aurantiacibacter spongiae]